MSGFMTMLINLMIIILFTSFLFTRMSSPMAMGLTLLVQTIFICGATGILSKSMWFPYILFLIFLGAMLVLFIYVASLASNEQFSASPLLGYAAFMFMSTLIIFSLFLDPLTINQPISIEMSSLSSTELLNSTPFNISMIYSPVSMNLTIFVILYLLLTLVVVVKITGFFWGPLRIS